MRLTRSAERARCALRRAILLVPVLALVAGAQAPVRAASAADSTVIRQRIYQRLFAGVELREDQRHAAVRTIAEAHVSQRELGVATDGASWRRIVRIHERRDSILATLVESPRDRARFVANAAAIRPRVEDWRP